MKKLFLVVIACFLLASCEKGLVYREYKNIPQFSWGQDYEINFSVDPPQTGVPYNLMVGLRHLSEIQYGNMAVNMQVTAPSGQSTEEELILDLRTPDGELIGEAMGDVTDIEISVKPGYVFEEAGTYNITMTHAMQDNPVSGIMEVGLVIKEATE